MVRTNYPDAEYRQPIEPAPGELVCIPKNGIWMDEAPKEEE